MGAGYHGGFGGTEGGASPKPADNEGKSTNIPSEQTLIAELEKKGIKFTKQDIVFITKDGTGQTVWLEKGNSSAGLEHILNGDGKSPGHAADFEKAFGIQRANIPSFLKNVISNGRVVSNTLKLVNGRQGYERIYYYDGKHYVLTGIGTNGFLVSAYPVEY